MVKRYGQPPRLLGSEGINRHSIRGHSVLYSAVRIPLAGSGLRSAQLPSVNDRLII